MAGAGYSETPSARSRAPCHRGSKSPLGANCAIGAPVFARLTRVAEGGSGLCLPSVPAVCAGRLWAAVQPAGSLYGLQHSNPVDTETAYRGPAQDFGQSDDPMNGRRIGGVNVFGGGLALYDSRKQIAGAIGISGNTSCADHNIAWRTRHTLQLDWVPDGVSANHDDNINYQGLVPVPSVQNDFSRPVCKIGGADRVSAISASLPAIRK
jgi:Haem degrading protein HbpS-like